jgi:hypothetical protein
VKDLALREQCRSLADAVSAAHRLFATQPEYRGAIVLWLTGARRTAADTRQVLPVWKELLAVPNWIPDNYARPLADAAVQFDRAGEHSEALAMYERFFASTLSWATPGTDQIDDYNGIRRALGMPPVDESFVKRKGWTSEPRKP